MRVLWCKRVRALIVLLALSTGGSVFTVGRTIVLVAGIGSALAFLALVHGVEFGTARAEPPAQCVAQRGPAAVSLERDLEDGREEAGRQN